MAVGMNIGPETEHVRLFPELSENGFAGASFMSRGRRQG